MGREVVMNRSCIDCKRHIDDTEEAFRDANGDRHCKTCIMTQVAPKPKFFDAAAAGRGLNMAMQIQRGMV